MADLLVLVPAPVLGPASWQPVAAELTAGGALVTPAAGGPSPVVGGDFLPYLRQLARDGVVPAWPQWFPEADPAELYPSEAARAAVLADARPLPLSFFEACTCWSIRRRWPPRW